MNATPRLRTLILLLICTAVFSTHLAAGESSLVRIQRPFDSDRGPLILAGVEIVVETNDAWLAVGNPAAITAAASRFNLAAETVETDVVPGSLALVGLRAGADESALMPCGQVIARGDDWTLVHNLQGFEQACLESPHWFFHTVDFDPLAAHRPPPAEWAGLADRSTKLVPDPLVQEMVDLIDTDVALSHWSALTQSSAWNTRHSSSQGCVDAAAYVHGLFAGAGLVTEYQHHTTGYADNIIGTLPGSVEPDKVYIAIGHLDDLPSSGPAPGADDNASGTAMVTAAAEVMSNYCFARTVKFVAVTGEEQGLHGSDHYADQAAALGEDIQAVLNGDMIGWEGDGQPAVEDLDINYNSGSQWLAQAMTDAAAEYQTGIAVNAIECPSMTYSDHAPFWANGFSAVCGITDNEGFCGEGGNYPYYHQSSDTIANCGPGALDFEAAAIRTYVATLAHLAQPVARIPDAPMGLTAQADGDNRIALSWLPQAPGVTVEVHRAAGGCGNPGPYSLVGQSQDSSFVDTTASGGVPYGYRVVARAAAACTSEVSTCVDASTTGACTEAPVFAGVGQVTNAAASDCLLTLDWQPPDHIWCGGPASYNVYRSTISGFTPAPANRVASSVVTTSWSDTDVISQETYHYIVRAVDDANGSEDQNTAQADGAPTGPAVIGIWTDDAGDTGTAKLLLSSPWSVLPGAGVDGAGYATGPYGSNTCAALATDDLIFDASPQLSFQSKFDIEDGWDKGELQISTDGGATWSRVTMTYPGGSSYTNDSCGLGTGTYFTGTQTSYAAFNADLSAWSAQSVRLRWLFSSDGYIERDGWWIDDIAITDVAVPGSCLGAGVVFIDDFESGDTSAWSQ
jgi:hypothetical protein